MDEKGLLAVMDEKGLVFYVTYLSMMQLKTLLSTFIFLASLSGPIDKVWLLLIEPFSEKM